MPSAGQPGPYQPPPQQQPYRHPAPQPMAQQPMTGGRPEGSGGRQVLIVLAVVLGLLVLLCAGVISFLLNNGTALGAVGTNRAVIRVGVVDQGTSAASYRLMKQVAAQRSLIQASEGRHTL